MPEFVHTPVLVSDVVDWLKPKPGDVIVDGTLGLGGHAEALLTAMNGTGKLIGIDQDATALSIANDRLRRFGDGFLSISANFRNVDSVVNALGIQKVDAILLDLGVSSLQLDEGSRGFSFKADAPLDMRMNTTDGITAADVLRTYTESELADIFWRYGEEKRSKYIAKKIVETRKKNPIEATGQLVEVVGGRQGKIHPATKVFQALRMEVNDEMGALEEVLPRALRLLAPGGKLAIITFHSLEDRHVKQVFRGWEDDGLAKRLNKKVIQADYQEKRNNPRSRSAKLRVIEKI